MTEISSIFSNEKLPFAFAITIISKTSFSLFTVIVIGLVGLWLEDIFGYGFFARFGALIALFGLLQLWLSVRYMDYKKTCKILMEKYLPEGSHNWDAFTWENHVKRHNPTLPSDMITTATASFSFMSSKLRKDMPKLAAITNSLITTQIIVAAIGTIIWAFGDFFANFVLNGVWSVNCVL